MKHIKQLKFVLAGIVAFTTVLTLIRPAITFENTICGLEEHTHTEECYQTIQNTVPHKTLNCSEESLHIHKHSPNCYDENNNIICGYADYVIHEHNEDCYDENNQLVCTLPEIKEHTHDSNCYDSKGNLNCVLPEIKKHIHEDSCFTQTEETVEEQQLVCDKQEHTHTEECYEKEEEIEYVCGKEEHTHDTSCYNENNELICDKEEHVHSSECEKTIEDNIEEEIPVLYSVNNTIDTFANETATVAKGNTFYYSTYGLGTYVTSEYIVTYRGEKILAYCIEPQRAGPSGDMSTIYNEPENLEASNIMTKIYYYSTLATGKDNFFNLKHPDFEYGKRFIITHIALAYANWDTLTREEKNAYGSRENFAFVESDSGVYRTNEAGRSLAIELYNYAKDEARPMPSAVMTLSNNNITAQIDGNIQKTETIHFASDNRQSVTFKVPDGVTYHEINGENETTVNSGGSVTLSGNKDFYFTAPLNKTGSFTINEKGTLNKDYKAYKMKTINRTISGQDNKYQDLAILFGNDIGTSISFTVKWINVNLDIKKVQSSDSSPISGVKFLHTLPDDNTELLTTNEKGIIQLQNLSSGIHKIQETAVMDGYQLNPNVFTFTVNTDGSITMDDLNGKDADYDTSTKTLTVKDKVNNYSLKIIKTNGNPDYKLKGAKFGLYKDQQCQELALSVDSIRETNENGELTFIGLENGVTYYLKEIYAPPGYIINDTIYSIKVELNPINNTKQVTINGNSEPSFATFNENGFDNVVLSLKISNDAIEYILPETGGPGDWLYIGSGIGLMTLAGYFLIKRRIHGKEDLISQ